MDDDPILAGTLVGSRMKCQQAQHVMGDMKHFALNDQESGRNEVNVIISKRAMRESDILPFQIWIEIADSTTLRRSRKSVSGDRCHHISYHLCFVTAIQWMSRCSVAT